MTKYVIFQVVCVLLVFTVPDEYQLPILLAQGVALGMMLREAWRPRR